VGLIDGNKRISRERKRLRSAPRLWMFVILLLVWGPILFVVWLAEFDFHQILFG
jgi:hypothetical protein